MWSRIARNRNEKPIFFENIIIFSIGAYRESGTDFEGFFMFFIEKTCFSSKKTCFSRRKIFVTSKNNIYDIVKCLETAQKCSGAF